MGSGAGGVKFRELTAARLPPPGESSNFWPYVQLKSLYYRRDCKRYIKRNIAGSTEKMTL
jgi:hypothetical protein